MFDRLEEHILLLEKRLMTYNLEELHSLLADNFYEFGSYGSTLRKKRRDINLQSLRKERRGYYNYSATIICRSEYAVYDKVSYGKGCKSFIRIKA